MGCASIKARNAKEPNINLSRSSEQERHEKRQKALEATEKRLNEQNRKGLSEATLKMIEEKKKNAIA
ncbi:unnamed protein product [Blepharisma stoltei]|uniref:Small VCP/p97-interacting protein n=1 Tax=Blepharisma stoltei TaxID=1481888 RepID=A0AAU9KDA1_9CILI|nr:unnamed protein product [Blepharisma stoltei]